MPANQVAIYALKDASGSVRYIGKANDPAKRLSSHLRDMKRRRTPVYDWMRSLVLSGAMPTMEVLQWCDADKWPECETYWIAKHRAEGSRLLNLADGGDEPRCSKAVRAANGRRNAIARQDTPLKRMIWLAKKEIGLALRNGWVSEAMKVKLRLAAARRPDLFGEYANV